MADIDSPTLYQTPEPVRAAIIRIAFANVVIIVLGKKTFSVETNDAGELVVEEVHRYS